MMFKRKQKLVQSQTIERDPLAGFGNDAALSKWTYKSGQIYLGRLAEDHGTPFDIGMNDDRHLFTMAQTRAGKGQTLIIQNCARYEGGLFCIDPKGEAASITAMRRGTRENAKGTFTRTRKFLGQEVAILDPHSQVRGSARKYRTAYNPLVDVDISQASYGRIIRTIADGAVPSAAGGNDTSDHFNSLVRLFLMGVMEVVKFEERARNQTLVKCYEMLALEKPDLVDYLAKRARVPVFNDDQEQVGIDDNSTPWKIAHKAWVAASEMGDDEWGSVRTTMFNKLDWLSDPAMQDHLAASDFSLMKTAKKPSSVYICADPNIIAEVSPWLRIIVQMLIRAKQEEGVRQTAQTLFILDEFPLLGHVKPIADSAGLMAGYGLKLWPFIQNIDQLKEHYPKNWSTFIGNAAATIAWAMNDTDSEKFVSERLGKVRAVESTHSYNTGTGDLSILGNSGASVNIQWVERPIRTENEARREVSRSTGRAYVIEDEGTPFMIDRQKYNEGSVGTLPAEMFDSFEHIAYLEKEGKVK